MKIGHFRASNTELFCAGQSGGGPFGLFRKSDATQGDVYGFAIPTNDGSLSILVSWDPKKPPTDFLSIDNVPEVSELASMFVSSFPG
jgi:hypothetical protein